jgi:tetratricopeptide (TPR) repeat protein
MATDPPRGARGAWAPWLLGGVVAGVVGLLALAPVSAVVASAIPEPLPAPTAPAQNETLQATSRIRIVPAGLPESASIESVDDVRPYAVAALGPAGADRLLSLVVSPWPLEPAMPTDASTSLYPFSYPPLEAVLSDAQEPAFSQAGAALGAALMLVADVEEAPDGVSTNAPRVAFGVLDRARQASGCDAQTNLLAIVAATPQVERRIVWGEVVRAQALCSEDPTPGWLWTQRLLGDGLDADATTVASPSDLAALESAKQAALDLVRAFPADPGAWIGLGEVYLTTGDTLAVAQPFTAQHAYQEAAKAFHRVRGTEEAAAGGLGAARAELGLGRAPEAADMATDAAEHLQKPGRALQLGLTANERAGQFSLAAAVAHTLAEAGPGAFPRRRAVIPLRDPLAWRSEVLIRVHYSLVDGGIGGPGLVADEGFIPAYREADDLTDDAGGCPEWGERRALFLAGDAPAAARGWPAEFTPIDWADGDSFCPDGEALRSVIDAPSPSVLLRRLEAEAEAEADAEAASDSDVDEDEDEPVQPAEQVDATYDARQNLRRWAGDLEGARSEALAWADALGSETALAHQRLGEIDYLMKDFDAAATSFAVAANRWEALRSDNDLEAARSQLSQGAALIRAGRGTEAAAVLRPLVPLGAQWVGYLNDPRVPYSESTPLPEEFAKISYYAATELADHELAVGDHGAATDDLATALSWADDLEGVVHLDTAHNSAAVAALGTGELQTALAMSAAAVEADPRNPVYLMTAAEVNLRLGDTARAVTHYRSALESDPTTYPAANNLAVLLARTGRAKEASSILRAAVHAEPGYALGWHNLGVVEGRRGPLHVPASQGALARAISLDAANADRPLELGLDTTTYRTSLDVSKPIPQGWSFAGSQGAAPTVTAGLLAVALAGVGLLSLRDTSPSPAAREWLEGLATRLGRTRRTRLLRRPWWALAATVAAFGLAFWRQAIWPWTGLAYGLGIAALVGSAMLARSAVARRTGRGVVQGTWGPGAVVGLVSGALGAPFAPLPVVRAPSANLRVALAAPLTLAVLSLALLAEAAVLRTPLTTSFCIATLVMAGSLLLPVAPLDGSRASRAGVVGVVGLLGAVLVLGLGLV